MVQYTRVWYEFDNSVCIAIFGAGKLDLSSLEAQLDRSDAPNIVQTIAPDSLESHGQNIGRGSVGLTAPASPSAPHSPRTRKRKTPDASTSGGSRVLDQVKQTDWVLSEVGITLPIEQGV